MLLTMWSSCCHSIAASVVQRIYIALPEEKARAHMFKVHLGDTPHDLSPQDFEELARHTDGFSGSDVAVVVKDVLMEPVRLTQDAGYFRLDLPANVDHCQQLNLLISSTSVVRKPVCTLRLNSSLVCWLPRRSIVNCATTLSERTILRMNMQQVTQAA